MQLVSSNPMILCGLIPCDKNAFDFTKIKKQASKQIDTFIGLFEYKLITTKIIINI